MEHIRNIIERMYKNNGKFWRRKMNATEYAIQILNDTDYGENLDMTDKDIRDRTEEQNKAICADYLDFVVAVNGYHYYLMSWEKDMARELNIKLED